MGADRDHWNICATAAASATSSLHADIGSNALSQEQVGDSICMRTAELHEVSPGGALAQREHYDAGSCVTIDIMLSQPGRDFDGGCLEFPASSHGSTPDRFHQGDALVFPSHKYHCV